MDEKIVEAFQKMFNYWRRGTICDPKDLIILKGRITDISKYQQYIESVEFYITEGMKNPDNHNYPIDGVIYSKCLKPYNKRTLKEKLEIVKLFTECTQLYLNKYTKVESSKLERYQDLAKITPKDRTNLENEELSKLANYFYNKN